MLKLLNGDWVFQLDIWRCKIVCLKFYRLTKCDGNFQWWNLYSLFFLRSFFLLVFIFRFDFSLRIHFFPFSVMLFIVVSFGFSKWMFLYMYYLISCHYSSLKHLYFCWIWWMVECDMHEVNGTYRNHNNDSSIVFFHFFPIFSPHFPIYKSFSHSISGVDCFVFLLWFCKKKKMYTANVDKKSEREEEKESLGKRNKPKTKFVNEFVAFFSVPFIWSVAEWWLGVECYCR